MTAGLARTRVAGYRSGMAPIPASTRRAEEARLAEMLDGRIPADAVVARGGGIVAVAWRLPGMVAWTTNDCLVCLWRTGEGPTGAAMLSTSVLDGESILAELAGGPDATLRWSQLRLAGDRAWRLHEDADTSDPRRAPGRAEALLRLAEGTDAAAVILSDDTGYGSPDRINATRSDGADATLVRAFLREHPWIGRGASKTGEAFMAVLREGGPDAAAAHVLATGCALAPEEAARVVDRTRRFRGTHWTVAETFPHAVRAIAAIPDDLLPPGIPEERRLDRRAQQAHHALVALAPSAAALARISGRDMRQVLGHVGDWKAYLDRVARRAGMDFVDDDADVDHVASAVGMAMGDMAASFAEQVLDPATLSAGLPWRPRRTVRGLRPYEFLRPRSDHPVRAALRLLLGDGTLPALAETCGRWHVRSGAIERELASVRGDVLPRGPRLFDDRELGDGAYLTCLTTAHELLDEGADGPDANGIPGLAHCVATYSADVASGDTCIVSLRCRLPDGGFARMSTAEVRLDGRRPSVNQHRGRANAPVDPALHAALLRCLEDAASVAAAALEAHRAPGGKVEPVPVSIHRTGSWERMRDMWSFALTRPQRSMGPAQLLREAGLPWKPSRASAR